MYVFVRFTGYILVIMGFILMILSFGTAIYMIAQGDALISSLNSYLLSSGGTSVFPKEALPYFELTAMFVFMTGLFSAAFGQLMLVFADIGRNSRETNIILRSLRNRGM
jgi:uncharacterized membrane protein